jgi:lipopolysaccharide transport system ATP-binding protein
MSDDVVIRVENLGKRYRLGAGRSNERYTALRDVIAHSVSAPFRAFRSRRNRNGNLTSDIRSLTSDLGPLPATPKLGEGETSDFSVSSKEDFWALREVFFEVRRGEVLGIIGRNGAGKSTLLKILSRITEPTEGRIRIKGRVASLLEVGTGFHPELTGRENIYLNGAILGMTRAEIKKKFDEIVDFAEIEKFLDTPVKRYSSGMYVRLAFAVAAHLEPEILIVDEVLAVGDAEFQKKCTGRMQDVSQEGGRTILLVSHDLSLIRKLCTRAILLNKGSIVAGGTAEEVCGLYQTTSLATSEALGAAERPAVSVKGKTVWIHKIEMRRLDGSISNEFSYNDSFVLRFHLCASATVSRFGLDWFIIDRGRFLAFSKSNTTQSVEFTKVPGAYECTVGPLPLSEGVYQITAGIRLHRHEAYWDWWSEALTFEIVHCDPFSTGYPARFDHSGPVVIPHSWEPTAVDVS